MTLVAITALAVAGAFSMANARKDAFEQLRAQVEAAQAAVLANPVWTMELEELARLAENHKLGTSLSGWVNPYPKDDPRSLLLEYQFADFHDRARFKQSLQGRQTGKDFTGQGEIAEDCMVRPGTDWMIGAPSERQALDSLDQGKIWAQAFDLVVDDYKETREGNSSQTLLKSAEIVYSNGSRARAVPGKPDTVRGRSANVYLTEFDFFEDAQATWRAILPSITNPLRGGEKKVRIKSTPNGKGGAMYKIWTKPDTPRMQWSRRLVNIYHAVLMGLPVDVAAVREALNDQEGWQQEYLCEFLDGSNVLLPYDLIALAESAEATEFWDVLQAGSAHPVYLGIDFGRTNDPTVCWTLQRVGDVLWTREVLVLEDTSSPDQLQILQDRIRSAQRVCFDYTGPGIGLGDFIVKEHSEWNPDAHKLGKVELCTFTTAFKREIFPKMRRLFEAPTRLRVPISTTIREDLHMMQQVITNGEYNYWSARTKLGHSDRCTALALAVRASSGPAYMPLPRRVSAWDRCRAALAGRRERSLIG
jgi:phage FluMu gp28-like protein